jgi:hypothetical protein
LELEVMGALQLSIDEKMISFFFVAPKDVLGG